MKNAIQDLESQTFVFPCPMRKARWHHVEQVGDEVRRNTFDCNCICTSHTTSYYLQIQIDLKEPYLLLQNAILQFITSDILRWFSLPSATMGDSAQLTLPNVSKERDDKKISEYATYMLEKEAMHIQYTPDIPDRSRVRKIRTNRRASL